MFLRTTIGPDCDTSPHRCRNPLCPPAALRGEIFRSDITGDGAFGGQSQTGASAYGDILPGTNIGSFGRDVKTTTVSMPPFRGTTRSFANQPWRASQALVALGTCSPRATSWYKLGADDAIYTGASRRQREPCMVEGRLTLSTFSPTQNRRPVRV